MALRDRVAEITTIEPGEVWAPACNVVGEEGRMEPLAIPHYAVSSLGRAVSLPRVSVQAGRYGARDATVQIRGGLLSPCMRNTRIGPREGPLVDVGRAVLIAFDRLPRGPHEVAMRLDGCRWHTGVDNLAWSGDHHVPAAIRFFEALAEYGGPELAHVAADVGRNLCYGWMDEVERGTTSHRRRADFAAVGAEFYRARARAIEGRRSAALERWASAR